MCATYEKVDPYFTMNVFNTNLTTNGTLELGPHDWFSDVATITFHRNLTYNRTYAVTIPSGSFKDIYGNELASDYFEFRTQEPPIPPDCCWKVYHNFTLNTTNNCDLGKLYEDFSLEDPDPDDC